jgi:hydroxymethylpyrimidine/phosphomethylpyrimidine kinase
LSASPLPKSNKIKHLILQKSLQFGFGYDTNLVSQTAYFSPYFPALSSREFPHNPPVVLTIAGHDPGSGAGLTADLQTFAAHGLFGTSVPTALTVQSTIEVAESKPLSHDFILHVLTYLHSDLPPSGIKIGMIGSEEGIKAITSYLQSLPAQSASNYNIPIVLDPIFNSSSGLDLTGSNSLQSLHTLLPLVTWITPNWSELAALTGLRVTSLDEAAAAAAHLGGQYPHLYIVVTAGDSPTPTDLLRFSTGEIHTLAGTHIHSTSTHGTGCAFSSALLSRLVLGDTPLAAAQAAKSYVTNAILLAPKLGHGCGPLNLLWPLTHPKH